MPARLCELALRATNAQALQCVCWWSASNSQAVLLGALANQLNRKDEIHNKKGISPADVQAQHPAATPTAPPIRAEINNAAAANFASSANQGSPVGHALHAAPFDPAQAAAGPEAPAAAKISSKTAPARGVGVGGGGGGAAAGDPVGGDFPAATGPSPISRRSRSRSTSPASCSGGWPNGLPIRFRS